MDDLVAAARAAGGVSDIPSNYSVQLPSTGHFTSFFQIMDTTSMLDLLFQSVDGYAVHHTISTVARTVLPHCKQFIENLNTNLSQSGSKVTADDLVGSLELLFEFGELHTHFPVDPSLRPVLLLGEETKYIGGDASASDEGKSSDVVLNSYGYPINWSKSTVTPDVVHCVLEAAEPSSGIRWCRTYFLQRGRLASRVQLDTLVINDGKNIASAHGDQGATVSTHIDEYDSDNNDEADNEEANLTKLLAKSSISASTTATGAANHTANAVGDSTISPIIEQGLRRLEMLYIKLYHSLRFAVRSAFSTHLDLLDAADMIQVHSISCICHHSMLSVYLYSSRRCNWTR
jgi:hypothetical protein